MTVDLRVEGMVTAFTDDEKRPVEVKILNNGYVDRLHKDIYLTKYKALPTCENVFDRYTSVSLNLHRFQFVTEIVEPTETIQPTTLTSDAPTATRQSDPIPCLQEACGLVLM